MTSRGTHMIKLSAAAKLHVVRQASMEIEDKVWFFKPRNGWDKIIPDPVIRYISKHTSLEKNTKFGDIINAGGHGVVYRGTWFGTDVAVKVVRRSGCTHAKQLDSGREISLAMKLHHPNIIWTYDWMVVEAIEEGRTKHASPLHTISRRVRIDVIVMEMGRAGTLQDLIFSYSSINWTKFHTPMWRLSTVMVLLFHIASALVYLHSLRIVHGDLTPSNVLLFKTGPHRYLAKISDFGYSRMIPPGHDALEVDFCSTLSHSAPETLHHGILSPASDVYAFGVIMWELIQCEVPYNAHPNKVYAIWNKEPLKFGTDCPDQYKQLSQTCMAVDVKNRPSMAQVFDDLKTQALRMKESKTWCSEIARSRQDHVNRAVEE